MTIELLIDAVTKSNLSKVTEELEKGVDVNGFIKPKMALEIALSNRDIEIAELLLRHGADIELIDSKQLSLLESYQLKSAVVNNYWKIAEFLITRGADVNYVAPNIKATYLHTAASLGSIEMAKVLLYYGVKIDAVDYEGFTALHSVTSDIRGVPMVKFLASNGADITIANNHGKTVLEHFREQGIKNSITNAATEFDNLYNSYVNSLSDTTQDVWGRLDISQDIRRAVYTKYYNSIGQDNPFPALTRTPFLNSNIVTNDGMTIELLIDAVTKSNLSKVTEELKKGGDVNGFIKPKMALEIALSNRDIEIAELLLRHGAAIELIDSNQLSLLESYQLKSAVCNNYWKIAEFLITRGADVNYVAPNSKATYLHTAASLGSIEMAKVLLYYGVKIDAVDYYGFTALHYVTSSVRDVPMAKFLASNGADITNHPGKTVLEHFGGQDIKDDITNAATEFDILYNLFFSGDLDAFHQAPLSSLPTRWAVYTKYYKSINQELPSLASFEAFLNKDIRENGLCNGLAFTKTLDLVNKDFINNFINKEMKIHNHKNTETDVTTYTIIEDGSLEPNDCHGEEESKEDISLAGVVPVLDGNHEG